MESQTRRNLMVSNFVGSFIGGVVGIFTAFLLSPTWMPVTILVGVLVGWLHKNVFSAIQEIIKKIEFRVRFALLRRKTSSLIKMIKARAGQARSVNWFPVDKLKGAFNYISRIGTRAVQKTIDAGWTTMSIPSNAWNWWKEHPFNQALLLKGAAFVIAFGGIAALSWFATTPSVSDSIGGWISAMFFLFMGMIMLQTVPSEMATNTEIEEMRIFYRSWEKINKYGKVGYFLHQTAKYLRQAIGLSLFLVISLSWLFTIAMIGIFGAYAAMIFLATARATWKAVMRYRFWICYGVTLSVTFMSWFMYHDSIGNLLEVGLLAVSTGVISGVGSLATQVVLEKFYRRTSFGRRLATEGMDSLLIAETGSYMSGMSKFGAVWFRQNKLALGFRTLCLGIPFVKPVKIV